MTTAPTRPATSAIAPAEARRRAPSVVIIASATLSMLGFHWDIAWHTDFVRDRFVTAPHLVILGGLAGALAGAWLRARPTARRSVVAAARQDRGATLSLIATLATIIALNLDNWWHVLFGFDLTLWSPPHLVLSLGFLCLLLGGLREAASLGVDPRILAAVPGIMFATATLLVFEFELGFLHYDMEWEPLALALFTGATLVIASHATRLVWAGTIAGVAALATRLLGLAINAVLGAPLPFPPPGILPAGIAFDLTRRSLTRRGHSPSAANTVALVAACAVMIATTASTRLLLGRTWWSSTVVLVGAIVGPLACLGGGWIGQKAALFITARTEHRPSLWARRTRALVAGCVATALIGATGLVVLDTTSPNYLQAMVTTDDQDVVTLQVPGATARDWATLIGGRADRPGRTVWLASMRRAGDNFSATLPPGELTWLGVWVAHANRAWINPRALAASGPINLERDAFRNKNDPPINRADVVISYLLLLTLVVAQVGYVAAWQPRRDRTRAAQ